LMPVGGNKCNKFGVSPPPPPNLSHLMPVGGNKCDEFGREFPWAGDRRMI
jgi:hypothetical protein